ncbi:unnamed protein product [Tilletia caries]|uniref:GST N-terminal domain-containing protein n=1 Tax=Tilletia caries TaxID=13290 RepID=A0ABN7IPP0_9BASI|nr:hypothetical protein CF335_g309 [Tilletia laevis]CAD6909757.1 unnamed protein product [Tilletia caries]CAD6960879.1 unnamed protein product [Tilletia controversa]CAD6939051.1 unnamed protein product [Tilletia caries]CAD6973008.1 unnamed protein product [Tilletia controversa]
MSDGTILYSWPESGNSYKVRLLASLLGIDFNVRDLEFLKQEQKEAWFLMINPKGEVPTLILNEELSQRDWLSLGRATIADVSVFVYVALAPMGDISLDEYKNVLTWINRTKALPGFITIPGLEDPLIRRGGH